MMDDTAYVQAAIDAGEAFFPAGTYRLTAPIRITKPVTIVGEPPSITNMGGTWFHIDHGGVGFDLNNAQGYYSGVVMGSFGICRNQPEPAPNWAPNDHDFDINIFGITDVNLDNLTLLNPTRGIKQTGGGGRININNIQMQPFKVGIQIDSAYDVCRISNIHAWVFWKDQADVHKYMLGNLKGISLGRCDNPMLTNIFTIFAQSGLHFYQNTEGATSKMHLVNADFDAGINGIWVDNSVTNGVSGQFANITHQGYDGSDNSIGLLVAGTSSNLSFSSIKTMFCGANGLRVDGLGNRISINDASVLYYDQSRKGFPAVEVAANNTLMFGQQPFIVTNAIGPQYGGAGEITAAVAQKVN
jgi:hypothetical protein